jgi:hypothetical protein
MGQQPLVANSDASLLAAQAPPVVPVPDAPMVKQKKVGLCWKCAVNRILMQQKIVRQFITVWFVILGHTRPFGVQF